MVRVCEPVFFKPTPIISLVFEKNDLFINLIKQNVYTFKYCSLIFKYPLCCLLTTFTNKYYNFGFWAEYVYVFLENGTIHIAMMKNLVSHILFLRKRGLIVYLAELKKGAIRPPPPPLRVRDSLESLCCVLEQDTLSAAKIRVLVRSRKTENLKKMHQHKQTRSLEIIIIQM